MRDISVFMRDISGLETRELDERILTTPYTRFVSESTSSERINTSSGFSDGLDQNY